MNFYFDLRPPGQASGQDRGAKTRPLGQLECANPGARPGGGWSGLELSDTLGFATDWFRSNVHVILQYSVNNLQSVITSFNPIRPGGGGGLRGLDGQTHSCQSETSYPMMPKLGDF